jgi:hypothetical protein
MQPRRPSSARPDRETKFYPRWLFVVLCVALLLHLNYWLWGTDRLVLGLPINLLYHVLLTLALSVVMGTLARRGWPAFLEDEDPE